MATGSAAPEEKRIDPLNELDAEQQAKILRRRLARARSALLNTTYTTQTRIRNAIREIGEVYE